MRLIWIQLALGLFQTDLAVKHEIDENPDFEKEKERLSKEKKRLEGELKRVNGMLSNEKFMSKAPEEKVAQERAKLEKYTAMMAKVEEELLLVGGEQ